MWQTLEHRTYSTNAMMPKMRRRLQGWGRSVVESACYNITRSEAIYSCSTRPDAFCDTHDQGPPSTSVSKELLDWLPCSPDAENVANADLDQDHNGTTRSALDSPAGDKCLHRAGSGADDRSKHEYDHCR